MVVCSKCGKTIPYDARYCPYCGSKISEGKATKGADVCWVAVESVEELKRVAVALNERFLPREWRCSVDEKRKKLVISVTAKVEFLMGLLRRSRRFPHYVSELMFTLESSLRSAEECLGVKFVMEGKPLISQIMGATCYYFGVYRVEK